MMSRETQPTDTPIAGASGECALPRRAFVRRTVGGATLGAVGVALGRESAPAANDDPRPDDDPLSAEVDARMALILARHGSRLEPSARLAIRKEVASMIARGRTLKAYPLTNADEPAPVFHAYRAPLE